MLLQLKLTALFVIFGIIVGFSSYLISTVATTKVVVESFVNTETNPIINLDDNYRYKYTRDWIYALFSDPESNEEARDLIKRLVPPNFKNSIFLTFYFRKKGTKEWYQLKDTAFPDMGITRVDEKTAEILNAARKDKVIDKAPSFFNFKQSHVTYFDATDSDDVNEYIVKTTINRENIMDYIVKKKNEGIPYLLFNLFLSLIIGAMFSRTITKPVRELSKKAQLFSRGNLSVRFSTTRKDDIGKLALSMNMVAVNISHRIQTMQTMNKIDRAVNSSLSRRDLLINVSDLIQQQFKDSLVLVLEKTRNAYRVAASSPDEFIPVNSLIEYSNFSSHFLNNDGTIMELDKESIEKLNRKISGVRKKSKGISFPLIQSEHIIGLMIIALDKLDEQDKEALAILADQVSVALLSMKEFEEKELMYEGMLRALSKSIDAKSNWTAGHSDRVAAHAVNLAAGIGLSQETLRLVKIAALLHDIGKLGISEDILNKPGKLTEEEYRLIKQHPEMGDTILRDIPNFEQIRFAVRHHHERWDGKGYPDALAGDNIPLIARIIAVADVWDAVTADRPYRKGFGREKSIEILKSERKKLFDPSLLDMFLKMI